MTRRIAKLFSTFAVSFLIVIVLTPAYPQIQRATDYNSPIRLGPDNAPIKLEVFYDMQCPSCASFHPNLKAVLVKYQGKLQVTFRHFPIWLHDKAFLAGIAVEAANQQGKGFEMIDILLSN